MGTKEKLVNRLKSQPKDFTFEEAERLLTLFWYVKTSKRKILLHKPHPGNSLKTYALKDIIETLIRNGNI